MTVTETHNFFSANDARIEVVHLSEHEVADYVFTSVDGKEHRIPGGEFVISEPSYDEVFERIDSTLTKMVEEFQKETPDQTPYARITHRQTNLIEHHGDRYVAVISISVLHDPLSNWINNFNAKADDTNVIEGEAVELEPAVDAQEEGSTQEEAPQQPTMLTFGQAIIAMEHGLRVTRVGWIGATFLYLCKDWQFTPTVADSVNGGAVLAPAYVKYVDGVNYVGWVPTTEEMRDNNWMVVE